MNINRFALPRSAWELWVAVLLALSIAVNIFCLWTIRDIGTRKWLHDYDLNQFEVGPFEDVKTQVLVNQKLIALQCKR